MKETWGSKRTTRTCSSGSSESFLLTAMADERDGVGRVRQMLFRMGMGKEKFVLIE